MKWTKELIGQKILEAKDGLGIAYMPTRSQLDQYYGDSRLSNRVGKTLGYYGWAERLGLEIQNNDTRKGKLAERWAAQYLERNGFRTEQMLQNYPFDLLVNGCVKVDAKYSHLFRTRDGYGFYAFALRKQVPTCDVYLLIAQSEAEERTVYILPSSCATQQQISTGEHHSTYHQYIDNVECIRRIAIALSEVS